MKRTIRIIITASLQVTVCLCFLCCSDKSDDFTIVRFDTDLYLYLTNNEPDSILQKHSVFLDILGGGILDVGTSESIGFYSRLKDYFSEPTLMRIYSDEQKKFSDLTAMNKELSKGLRTLLKNFPGIKSPEVYIHVSGFSQNIIVTDDILSLSGDKYLGPDYPVYLSFFEDYQRRLMCPERIVPDYLLGFMMANLPFSGNYDVLLDRILYEGKLRYILSKLLPKRRLWEHVGYDREQYEWCIAHQSLIWKTVLDNQHLFTADYINTTQYLKEAPYTNFLPVESPGKAGVWLGFQIISSYMKNKPGTSLRELMENINYAEILKQSKYRAG